MITNTGRTGMSLLGIERTWQQQAGVATAGTTAAAALAAWATEAKRAGLAFSSTCRPLKAGGPPGTSDHDGAYMHNFSVSCV